MMIRIMFAGFALIFTCFTGVAFADQSCPTQETANDAILKIHGFTPVAGHRYEYNIGMFDFKYGNYDSVLVGACIRSSTLGTEILYAITDKSGNLLAHLPRMNNHLCLSNKESVSETTYVLDRDESLCDTTMHPLDYHGFMLVQYGRRGSEHLHGGYGSDVIYGGPGNDTISDYNTITSSDWPTPHAPAQGWVYGESGNDWLFTGEGFTGAEGGAGVDAVINPRGGRVGLQGGDDNDCCVFAATPNSLSGLDCGKGDGDITGNSGAENFGQFKNCERKLPSCGAFPFSCLNP